MHALSSDDAADDGDDDFVGVVVVVVVSGDDFSGAETPRTRDVVVDALAENERFRLIA